jgi:hypothetical protein
VPDFVAEPLAIAERLVRNRRHRFIDFDEYMNGESFVRHELVIGSHRTVYDRCHHVSLWDHSHAPYPVHTLVRPYLAELEQCQGGYVPKIEDLDLFERQVPMYFGGPCSGQFACVDLVSAYWQLYRVATLDLAYDGQSTPRNGQIRFLGADELRPYKLFRNAVIGFIRAEQFTKSTYGEFESSPIGPRWQRPSLWAWLIDTLEAIAWEARMLFGAVHIQVDGYIVPASVAPDLVQFLVDEWHLEASIRASGLGTITGLGHWTIEGIERGVDTEEGFTHPHVAGIEKIDNMAKRDWTGLREWFLAAQEVTNEKERKLVDTVIE